MTDFKVGDKMRRRGGSNTNHYTVKDVSTLFIRDEIVPIVQFNSLQGWYAAANYERVPEPKPQYRIRVWSSGLDAVMSDGGRIVVSVGAERPAAERVVRAALDALHPEGWEEVK